MEFTTQEKEEIYALNELSNDSPYINGKEITCMPHIIKLINKEVLLEQYSTEEIKEFIQQLYMINEFFICINDNSYPLLVKLMELFQKYLIEHNEDKYIPVFDGNPNEVIW